MATYADWNKALREHFFPPGVCAPVHLALDDDAVEHLRHHIQVLKATEILSSGVDDLCRAVRDDVLAQGWLRRSGVDCLARCSLFVLAYSRVEHRDTPGAPAYWEKVWRLVSLESRPRSGRLPLALTTEVFQELWARTADAYPLLLLPETRTPRRWTGQHCNIRLVQSQAALRQLDLHRVAELLSHGVGGRRPRRADDGEVAWRFVNEHSTQLRPYARGVLETNRAIAYDQVVTLWSQIRHDPTLRPEVPDRRRSAPSRPEVRTVPAEVVYLQMDGRRRLFAYHTKNDQSMFTSELANELWRCRHKIWVFDALHERYEVEDSAVPGEKVLLFLPADPADQRHDWESEILELADHRQPFVGNSSQVEGLPVGWTLVRIRSLQRPPTLGPRFGWIFAGLEVEGGLRLGHRRWLHGAGPQVRLRDGEPVEVDGVPRPPLDGFVNLRDLSVGHHEVCNGGRVLRIEITTAKHAGSVNAAEAWQWLPGNAWPMVRARTQPVLTLDGPFFEGDWTDHGDHELRIIADLETWSRRVRATLAHVERAFRSDPPDPVRFVAIVR